MPGTVLRILQTLHLIQSTGIRLWALTLSIVFPVLLLAASLAQSKFFKKRKEYKSVSMNGGDDIHKMLGT